MSGWNVEPLIDALLARDLARPERVLREIAPEDEMFLVAAAEHEGDLAAARAEYFATALRVVAQVRRLAEWRFSGLAGIGKLLDFASGYGRVTRLLAAELGRERVWAAETLPGAVVFQRERLGVTAIATGPLPERLACDERFDFILASSLFSHLPPHRFRGWLERLARQLSPRGVLAFSVHDAALMPAWVELPESGIHFAPESESRALDPGEYGSTWVSEAFVRAAVDGLGLGLSCHRLPRGHCGFQDLYLAVAERDVDFAALAYDRGLDGAVESVEIEAPGRLAIAGWAADLESGESPAAVELLVPGERPAITTEFARRQLDADGPGRAESEPLAAGFRLEVDLGAVDPLRVPFAVLARSRRGVEVTLHAGDLATLKRSIERLRRFRLEARVRELEARLSEAVWERDRLRQRATAIEASAFWRLRNAWFTVKRLLRLSDEY